MSKVLTMDAAKSFDEKIRGIALPRDRVVAQREGRILPDATIVSADNHWSLIEDIFVDKFPAHLKDRAPRLSKDENGLHVWRIGGESIVLPMVMRAQAGFETIPGASDIDARMHALDAEGIDKEIAFGNKIGMFYTYPDLEVREWVFRIYNEHLAEMQAKAPGRFYGVGLVNYWDPARTAESLAELKSLGLKTFLLPQMPKGANQAPLDYCLPEMNPLWEAIEATGLPVCFHVGEFFKDGIGGIGITVMNSFGPFRKTLGELIFGGIFDRHPDLQVVFAEAEINWVPGALQTASMLHDCYAPLLEPKIKHHPRHYWHNNCYATFMHDPAGLRLLDVVGADRAMWSSDYPHPEGTYSFSTDAAREIVEVTTDSDARMILGGNAIKVFDL